MKSLEVIVNVWYVRDEDGFVYSLRVKPYVFQGAREEKLAFLQERALLDYLIAEPFPIPEHLYYPYLEDGEIKKIAVAHMSGLATLDSPVAPFEEAFKIIEDRFPAQSEIDIPQDPIVCGTPLMQDSMGVIRPHFIKTGHISGLWKKGI
jgi:hypothetical protein